MLMIPLAAQAVNLVAAWQSVAPEGCPYVFMQKPRWDYYRRRVETGRWCAGTDLVNNLLRRFKTICRQAGAGIYNFRDMRCSCITNGARQPPIYVVQQLAGHSDMRTTQRYYLLVQQEDLDKARDIQAQLLGPVPQADLMDPKVTCSHRKRLFPDRRPCQRKRQLLWLKANSRASLLATVPRFRPLEVLTAGRLVNVYPCIARTYDISI